MSRGNAMLAVLGLALLAASTMEAQTVAEPLEISRNDAGGITIVARDAELREVFEMLARSESLNIALSDQVEGRVSMSLFDVPAAEAVRAVAQAAGYAVDRRDGAYLIVDFDDLGQDTARGATEVRSFKIQYSDPEKVREILEKHLSRFGEITALEERRMIVVEDLPDFLDRVASILEEIDQQPQQILLEAKVLEIGLNRNDTLGIDWNRASTVNGTDINVGVRNFTTGTLPGLFFNIMNDNLEGALEALAEDGRVRALASPQLLTMENEEAEVLVGSRLGYRVTTTINQVTTESVQFIESGVILRFKPSVDRQGRVLLEIHPEVSTGIISDGVPNQTTTEVTTQLLADDGQRIFIGGLIRDSADEGRRGVPFVSRIPVFGLLFGRHEWNFQSSETIVIVKPTIQTPSGPREGRHPRIEQFDRFEPVLDEQRREMEDDLDQPWLKATTERSAASQREEVVVEPLPSARNRWSDLHPEPPRPWDIHP
jgi:type II secretory pathway component GspD/PulD (secretin)